MFDRFDICEAFYLFARHFHTSGDTSDEIFKRLRRIGYKPGLTMRLYDDPELVLSGNALEIYDHLVATHPDAKGAR